MGGAGKAHRPETGPAGVKPLCLTRIKRRAERRAGSVYPGETVSVATGYTHWLDDEFARREHLEDVRRDLDGTLRELLDFLHLIINVQATQYAEIQAEREADRAAFERRLADMELKVRARDFAPNASFPAVDRFIRQGYIFEEHPSNKDDDAP